MSYTIFTERIHRGLIALVCIITAITAFSSCGRFSSGDNLVYSAIEDYDNGDYEQALEKLQQAGQKKFKAMKQENYYYYLGETYFRLGDYERSLAAHTRALQIKPELFKSMVTSGVCYSKLGNNKEALKMYERALKYDPENADSVGLYVSMASLYISSNKPHTAIDYLEKAVEIYPEHPAAHAYLALAYAMEYEYDRSDEQFVLASAYGYGQIDVIKERIEEIKNRH